MTSEPKDLPTERGERRENISKNGMLYDVYCILYTVFRLPYAQLRLQHDMTSVTLIGTANLSSGFFSSFSSSSFKQCYSVGCEVSTDRVSVQSSQVIGYRSLIPIFTVPSTGRQRQWAHSTMMCSLYILVGLLFEDASGFANSHYRRQDTTHHMRMSSILLNPNLSPDKLSGGSWFAILAKSGYAGVDLPVPIEVAGEKLVAWKSPITSEWSVMQDICPHRLAPLSQGRVDPISGCIECPYHGQQFDSTGACTKIPQSDSKTFPASTSAIALPVYSTGDLLWAFLPLSSGQASNFPTLPDVLMPGLTDCHSFFVRDLPYSFDFLVENFMDPAHIPFAHHSLQGSRADGSPIPMQVLTSYDNATHLEVAYQDSVGGKRRDGIVSFTAPCHYNFRTKDMKTGLYGFNLVVVVTPVSPGTCRVFFEMPQSRKISGKIPVWLLHSFSNKFIDTDVWVHDQERFQRSSLNAFVPGKSDVIKPDSHSPVGKKYVMTTQSDTGARAWRTWWAKHMVESPIFGEPKVPLPWISREDQLNRYENHAKYCSSCRGALANADKLKKIVPFLAVFLAAVAPTILLKFLAVGVAYGVNEAAESVRKGILGPDRGDVSSAAQFNLKK